MKIIAAWAFIGFLVAADLAWLAIVIVALWFMVVVLNYVTNPQLSEGSGFHSDTWDPQDSEHHSVMTQIENLSKYKGYDEIGCCVNVYGETMNLWFSAKVEVLRFFRDYYFLVCDERSSKFHGEHMDNEFDLESKRNDLESNMSDCGEEMNNSDRQILQSQINDLESKIDEYEEQSNHLIELDDITRSLFDKLVLDENVSMTKISNLLTKTFPGSIDFVGTFSSICTGKKGMSSLRMDFRESRGMRLSDGPLSNSQIEDFKDFLCELEDY